MRKKKNVFCDNDNNIKKILIAFVFVIVFLLTGLVYPGFLRTLGVSALIQSSWVDGAESGSSTTDLSGWTKYDSASAIDTADGIRLGESRLKWTPTPTGRPGVLLTEPGGDELGGSELDLKPDGEDGAIMAWQSDRNPDQPDGNNVDIRVQKVSVDGAPLWGSDGILVSCDPSNPGQSKPYPQKKAKIISDNLGGAIIAWEDWTPGPNDSDVYIQRIDDSGEPVWGDCGLLLSTDPLIPGDPAPGQQTDISIVTDGAGGAVVVWTTNQPAYKIMAQRIDSAGTILWGNDGMSISTLPFPTQPDLIFSEGIEDSAVVVFNSDNNIYIQAIGITGFSAGTLVFGDGIPISVALGDQTNPQVIANYSVPGVPSLAVVWEDTRNGDKDIYAQALSQSCTDPGSGSRCWENGVDSDDWEGIPISEAVDNQMLPSIVSLESDGFFIAWGDRRSGSNDDFYAQRIDFSGTRMWNNATLPAEDWDGIPIATGDGDQAVSSDFDPVLQMFDIVTSQSLNGIVVSWGARDTEQQGGYVQLVDLDGIKQWGSDGIFLSRDADDPRLAPSGTNSESVIVVWPDRDSDLTAQKIGGAGYAPSGYLISSVFDAGSTQDWSTISWDDVGNGGTARLITRTAVGDPTNISPLGTAYASSTMAGQPGVSPEAAYDNTPYTPWFHDYVTEPPLDATNPQWVAVDFGSQKEFKIINMMMGGGGGGFSIPLEFNIEVSDDFSHGIGDVWDPVSSVTVSATPSLDPNNFTGWDITGINATVGDAEIVMSDINGIVIPFFKITLPSSVLARQFRILISDCTEVNSGGGIMAKVAGLNQVGISAGEWSCNGWEDCPDDYDVSGSNITSPAGRYIQYAVMLNGGASISPIIDEVGLSYGDAGPAPAPSSPPTYSLPQENEEISQPVTPSPQVCSHTLAQVQASPIPPFNPTWGLGYPWGGRVQWALDHRAAIYKLYVDYLGRQPCEIEVNWILQHDNDINNIRYNILISEEYQNKHR